MLHLHIWGPAFGLPSVDAECLVAVAYCNALLRSHQWCLVAASDTALSPTGDFPLLVDEDKTYIAGFRAIKHYLHQQHGLSLDTPLSTAQHANAYAISTLITTRAQPLLDFSLYASHENYASVVRPSFSSILPQSAVYTVPPHRHAAAIARIKPLGLTPSAVDDIDPHGPQIPGSNVQEQEFVAASPSLLFRSRQSVRSALRQQNAETRFRLDALIAALCEPLEEILGNKTYLLTEDSPTSADCVAFGYLALMLYPSLPNSWLADTLRHKHARLVHYIEHLRELFNGTQPISPTDALSTSTSHAPSRSLPWHPAPRPTWRSALTRLASAALDAIISPSTRSDLTGRPRIQPLADTPTSKSMSLAISPTLSISLFAVSLASYLTISHFVLSRLYARDPAAATAASTHIFRAPLRPATLRGMGEAGAALAVLGGMYSVPARSASLSSAGGGGGGGGGGTEENAIAAVVEVDVDAS